MLHKSRLKGWIHVPVGFAGLSMKKEVMWALLQSLLVPPISSSLTTLSILSWSTRSILWAYTPRSPRHLPDTCNWGSSEAKCRSSVEQKKVQTCHKVTFPLQSSSALPKMFCPPPRVGGEQHRKLFQCVQSKVFPSSISLSNPWMVLAETQKQTWQKTQPLKAAAQRGYSSPKSNFSNF